MGGLQCRPDYTQHEKDEITKDIMREITSLWQTDELRRHKPTPVDGEFYFCTLQITFAGCKA